MDLPEGAIEAPPNVQLDRAMIPSSPNTNNQPLPPIVQPGNIIGIPNDIGSQLSPNTNSQPNAQNSQMKACKVNVFDSPAIVGLLAGVCFLIVILLCLCAGTGYLCLTLVKTSDPYSVPYKLNISDLPGTTGSSPSREGSRAKPIRRV